MSDTVRIIECTDPTGLFRHYDGQDEPQPAYIELDLREGTLLASYDAEIGSAVPETVYHGIERRYGIPILTAEAANRTMRELAPLADRILADSEEEWNGNSHVARFGDDARAAEEEIEQLLCLTYPGNQQDHTFDEADLLAVWDIDAATNGCEVDEYGITADTTDGRLDEIEAEILSDLASINGNPVAVCHGLDDYLRQRRDDLADEDPLTPAEVRTARERLGVTGDRMGELLRVNPRTVRSWEQGRDPVPGRIRPQIAELKAATDKAVADMVAACEGMEEPVLTTYRDDDEYKKAHGAGRWSASWHRQVCARVAEQAGARIDYA